MRALGHDSSVRGVAVATALLMISVISFLPSIIAISRGHNSAMAIVVLNIINAILSIFGIVTILLGFAFFIPNALIWLICLIWSLTGNTKKRDKQRAEMMRESMLSAAASVQPTSSRSVDPPATRRD
jgi:hypothetical protein